MYVESPYFERNRRASFMRSSMQKKHAAKAAHRARGE
jgi:hypothetical protein